jgi:hypothetical protein
MQQIGPETSWSPSSVTPQQIARELLRRKDAAENLIAFTEYTFARYRTAEHHRIIAEQLERVERGEIDRLMLLVPPRHGKSELARSGCRRGFLGGSRTSNSCRYRQRKAWQRLWPRGQEHDQQPEYRAVFDTTLAEDSQAKGKWHTSDGGIYYALGIGGSVLGRGGDCILD